MGDAGMNAEFRRWNTSTGSWDKISELNSIDGPNMSREVFDTSPDLEYGYRTFAGGKRDPGAITINGNFTRDSYDTLLADYEDDSAQNYELVLPDADNTSCEFEGLITELPLSVPAGKMTINFAIKITGQPTIESGSGASPG